MVTVILDKFFPSTMRNTSEDIFDHKRVKHEVCMYSSLKKKEKKTPIYFNTNYRTEMKLVKIIMNYCLLKFYALKFSLEVRLQGGSLPNFNFYNVNPQIFQRNSKIHLSNCLENIFSQHF